MIARHPDWLRRLGNAIIARAEAPAAWGKHDCCRAACALIEAMTGTDPGRGLWRYKTRAGAYRVLAREAPDAAPEERMAAVAARRFRAAGMRPVPVLRAQRGDAVLLTGAVQGAAGEPVPAPVLGIVDMSGAAAVVPGVAGGWQRYAPTAWRAAWRVGA